MLKNEQRKNLLKNSTGFTSYAVYSCEFQKQLVQEVAKLALSLPCFSACGLSASFNPKRLPS